MPEIEFFDTAMIAHFASFVVLMGFVVRDQLLLRGLVTFGTFFYILFYWVHPPEPLWISIFWNVAFALINIVMMGIIVWERTTLRLDEAQRRLFAVLNLFNPGEFRRLMRIAEPFHFDADTPITTAGETPDHIWFVLDGKVQVSREGESFEIGPRVFVGEIAFLMRRAATADTTLLAGASGVRWPYAVLNRMLTRNPSMRIAFHGLLNQDMAAKLSA